MNIMELSGLAWDNAIQNVMDHLGLNSFPNDWRTAQSYAIEHELKFDLNGNITEKETAMSKYEVIKKVMESTRVCEDDKVYAIEMFLKGWYTEQNIEWIWVEEE